MINVKNIYGGDSFINIDEVIAVDQCGYLESGKDAVAQDIYVVILRHANIPVSVRKEGALIILEEIAKSKSKNEGKTYAIDDLMSAIDTVNSVRKMLSEVK